MALKAESPVEADHMAADFSGLDWILGKNHSPRKVGPFAEVIIHHLSLNVPGNSIAVGSLIFFQPPDRRMSAVPCGRSRRNWCHEATWGEGNMQFFGFVCCCRFSFLKYISLYIAVFYCVKSYLTLPGACPADFFGANQPTANCLLILTLPGVTKIANNNPPPKGKHENLDHGLKNAALS